MRRGEGLVEVGGDDRRGGGTWKGGRCDSYDWFTETGGRVLSSN